MLESTVGDVVASARRRAWGSRREPHNRLAAGIDATTTTLTLVRPGHSTFIAEDVYLCIGTELMYVTAVDNTTITVERGVDSTAAVHASGARVEAGRRWFTTDLIDLLRYEVTSWPDDIFTLAQVQVSLGVTERSIDLPLTRFRFPLNVRRKVSNKPWVDMSIRSYRIETGVPVSDFPSGNALIVTSNPDPADYLLDYAQGFDTSGLDDPATTLASIGVTSGLVDIAVYGVAYRALASDETARSDGLSQPEPRTAAEVEPGDRIRAASAYKALRDERLGEEARRLRQLHRPRI